MHHYSEFYETNNGIYLIKNKKYYIFLQKIF